MLDIKKIITIKKVEKERKRAFITDIITSSAPSLDFYIMVSLSSVITALGLINDNIALVIAGMIVAPLLSPLLAIALGSVILNVKMVWRSLKIFILSTLMAVIFSLLSGMLFDVDIAEVLLIERMEMSWLTFSIAIVAGIIASYSWTRPDSKTYLSGVAIAVTIIPPLSSIGLTLSNLNISLMIDVSNFFLMNVFGIFLGGLLVFSIMNFKKVKKTATKEIEKEENCNNKPIK
jgi:uncharacterized hydrophobic protein (TIGR00271 family)